MFNKIAQEIREAVSLTAMAPGEEMVFHPSSQRVCISLKITLEREEFLEIRVQKEKQNLFHVLQYSSSRTEVARQMA